MPTTHNSPITVLLVTFIVPTTSGSNLILRFLSSVPVLDRPTVPQSDLSYVLLGFILFTNELSPSSSYT